MKKCFKCGKEKELSEFYKHSQMADGHLNKCKECSKNDVNKRERKLRKEDPIWAEKEKDRVRHNYHRLNYKEKHKKNLIPEKVLKAYKTWQEKYPEKRDAHNHSILIKSPKGLEKHHWSYNKIHFKDVIFLSEKDHKKIHRFIIYDQERKMYRNTNNELLDTIERHKFWIDFILTNKPD